jgi:hypothetical protein
LYTIEDCNSESKIIISQRIEIEKKSNHTTFHFSSNSPKEFSLLKFEISLQTKTRKEKVDEKAFLLIACVNHWLHDNDRTKSARRGKMESTYADKSL